MKIVIFSETKSKKKKKFRNKMWFIFNFTYAVQILLESVYK